MPNWVISLPRTLFQWKSPPTPNCVTWNSCDRKSSLDPPIESSDGWLKFWTYTESALISGVKNFVSKGRSFARGVPFSQVQSANAKGSGLAGISGFLSVLVDSEAVRAVAAPDGLAGAGVPGVRMIEGGVGFSTGGKPAPALSEASSG